MIHDKRVPGYSIIYPQDECNCSISIIMTAPVYTDNYASPATPLIGGWTVDNEAPRHSHNYRGANILIGDKLPSKLSKHVDRAQSWSKHEQGYSTTWTKVVTFITTKTDSNVSG